jgi:hypothetical protein
MVVGDRINLPREQDPSLKAISHLSELNTAS